MVQVQTTKGIALHVDRESGAAVREGRGEALTGEDADQALSRIIHALENWTKATLLLWAYIGVHNIVFSNP